MSKKILILTYGFHPVQSPRSFRATELAIELSRQGHQITVLGPHREGIDDFLAEHSLHYISYGDITWRVPQLKGSRRFIHLFNRAMVRGLGLLMEYPAIQLVFLARKKLKQLGGFDGLISIAVPYTLHWAVASIWKKEKDDNPAKVWIADCGDPYCGRENDTFRVPFYFAWVEKWFMKKANFITVPTESAINGYFKQFHQKIKVIPQGFRFKEYQAVPRENPNQIYFVYGGGFIPGRRDPREFIEFINKLDTSYDYHFDIFTTTPQFVHPHIKENDRIKVHAPIKREEFMHIAASADFLVNFSNKGAVQTPSKLIDYAMLKKPILNIDTGDLNQKVVLDFLNRNYSDKLEIADYEKYKVENVAKHFLDLMAS